MEYKRLGSSELLVSKIGLGIMTYGQQNTIAEAHEQLDYAILSIQNAYNLINRTFDSHLAKACYREQVSSLAYSPIAFGHLSGKYVQGSATNTRITLFPNFGQRYNKVNVKAATAEYVAIAKKYDLPSSQLALAFVRSRWFVASTIIGATTMEQLKENIDSANIQLNTELLAEVDSIHARYFNPAP